MENISGPGSFAVQFGDHLRSGIICGPGIICAPVQYSFILGMYSFLSYLWRDFLARYFFCLGRLFLSVSLAKKGCAGEKKVAPAKKTLRRRKKVAPDKKGRARQKKVAPDKKGRTRQKKVAPDIKSRVRQEKVAPAKKSRAREKNSRQR